MYWASDEEFGTFIQSIYIALYIHELGARWCPKAIHFLTRWVSRLLRLPPVSWVFARVGVHHLFHFAFHISVFYHSLFTCMPLDLIRVSFYDRRICTHSIDPSLADGEFPGLGLALVPDVVIPWQRRSMGRAWSRNLVSNFCPGRGLNLGPRSLMAANFTTRLRRTPRNLVCWLQIQNPISSITSRFSVMRLFMFSQL